MMRNLTTSWNNISNNTSEKCSEYLNIRPETGLERNLKLTAYSVAFIVAMIGNILVIAIVLRKSQLKTTTNMFIINIAASDVIMALVCMPASMHYIANENKGEMLVEGAMSIVLCKATAFVQGVAVAASVLTRITLAIDRYLAIVYPFSRYITRSKAKMLIMCVWFMAAIINSPLLYAMKLNEKNICIENWEPYFDDDKAAKEFTLVHFVFLYVLPLVVVTFLYTALIKELWRSVHSNKTVAFMENKAVLKMLVSVIIIFAVCWLPVHVTVFVQLYSDNVSIQTCGISPIVYFIGWFMGHVNSSINPIIYFCFNERFQQELIKWTKGMKNVCGKRERPSTASFIKPRIIVTQCTPNQSINASIGVPNNSYNDENCAISIDL